MASKYFNAAGAGNWGDTSSWAASDGGATGEAVPSASDDVFFTSTNVNNCVVNVAATCNDLDFSGGTGYSGTFSGSSTLAISGSATLDSAMTKTHSGNITFDSGASETVTSDGITWNSSVIFLNAAGTWTLQDAFSVGGSKDINLVSGTLDTNDQTFSTGDDFISSSANVRTLTLGSSTLNIGDDFNVASVTNFTFNSDTSTINLTSSGGRIVAGAGLTFYDVNFTGGGTNQIDGANTYHDVTVMGTASKTNRFNIPDPSTITGTLTITGESTVNRIWVTSATIGTAKTVTAANVSLSNCDFEDITAAGAASPFTGTSISAENGCTNITETTPVTRYWVGDTGSWSTAAEWSTSSGGGGGASVPLVQDTTVFDANSGSGVLTITVDMPRVGTIDTTGMSTLTPTLTLNTGIRIYGNLNLTDTTTLNSPSTLNFVGRGSQTITSDSTQFTGGITIEAFGGTYTLQDDLANDGGAGDTIIVTYGTFDANDFNVTYGKVDIDSGGVRRVDMGSGMWTLNGSASAWDANSNTNLTLNAETSTLKFTYAGTASVNLYLRGLTYYNIWVDGITTGYMYFLDGFTCNEFKATPGTFLKFDDNVADTYTVSALDMTGSSGNEITIISDAAGAAFDIVGNTGGDLVCDWLILKDSAATGTSTFYAGANSTNVSGNSGWDFSTPAGGSNTAKDALLLGVG